MAAGGIDGCYYSRSKKRFDLSDSLLPFHPSGGAGYDGIQPAKRVRDWRRTTAERCAESGCQPYSRSSAEQLQLRLRAVKPHAERVQHSTGDPRQHQQLLEGDRAHRPAVGVTALPKPEHRRGIRFWRHGARFLLLAASSWKTNVGYRPSVRDSYSH